MTVVPGGWSVSCEAAFYVVLPLALRLIAGRLWRALLLAAASALAALLLSRHTALHGGGTFSDYIHPGIQAPAFAAGGAASVLAQRVRLPRVPGPALALLAAAVAGVPFVPVPPTLWGLPQHLLFAPLEAACAALAAQHPPRLLASAPMRRLGEGSYSIYLVHFALLAPSLTVSEWLLPGDGWPTMALHFGLTAGCGFGLACVTYRWIEQPGIRWAARLLRHRTAHADIPSSRRERQASGPHGARVRVGSLSVPRFSSNSVHRAPRPAPAQFTAGPLHGRAGQDAQASASGTPVVRPFASATVSLSLPTMTPRTREPVTGCPLMRTVQDSAYGTECKKPVISLASVRFLAKGGTRRRSLRHAPAPAPPA